MDPYSNLTKLPIFILLIVSNIFTGVTSDTDTDKYIQECGEPLSGIATCLPYVQSKSKAPTKDCCIGLKNLLNTNKKCLCVVVAHGNDPEFGLSINETLALGLPNACNAPADISECPALLHLDPNSPEAKIFKPSGPKSNSTTAKSPTGSPMESPKSGPLSAVSLSPGPSKNGQAKVGKRWMGLKVLVGGLLLGIFT